MTFLLNQQSEHLGGINKCLILFLMCYITHGDRKTYTCICIEWQALCFRWSTVYTKYIVVVQLGVTVSYKVMFFLSTIKQQQMLSP